MFIAYCPDTAAKRITVAAIVYRKPNGVCMGVCKVSVCLEGPCSTCDVDSAAAPAPVTYRAPQ